MLFLSLSLSREPRALPSHKHRRLLPQRRQALVGILGREDLVQVRELQREAFVDRQVRRRDRSGRRRAGAQLVPSIRSA